MMSFSAYAYFTQPAMQQAFHHLGFSDTFRIELATAKLIGVVVLIAPLSGWIKEWAYAGFAFTFLSAFLAHTAAGDPLSARIAPLMALAILVVSHRSYHQLTTNRATSAQPQTS
jgi:hypothetical protein